VERSLAAWSVDRHSLAADVTRVTARDLMKDSTLFVRQSHGEDFNQTGRASSLQARFDDVEQARFSSDHLW
jgi:hypothetical protein